MAAVMEEDRLPIHALAREGPDALELALHGGEDYELLFTAAPQARIPRSIAGVPIRRIGSIRRRRAGQPLLTLVTGAGRSLPLKAAGWQHFIEKS